MFASIARYSLFFGVIIIFLSACSTPVKRLHQTAQQLGYNTQLLAGKPWFHVIFSNHKPYTQKPLHVYIEGDGTPWVNRFVIATDPTPRNPIMLHLMSLDNAASIYLGRPCYHGLAANEDCHPLIWTQQRYAKQIVASMAHALRHYLHAHHINKIIFIGHSGGGTLAVLLAREFHETVAIATIAANLDIDAWTTYHRYTPLTGSLNPAKLEPLPASIKQWHFAGKKDQNTPFRLMKNFLDKQHNSHTMVLSEQTHNCCWQKIWPQLLETIEVSLQLPAIEGTMLNN